MSPIDPGSSGWTLPDPAAAPPGAELIAVGAAADPATLLAGYRRGLFAMELGGTVLGWYSPDPRGVLPLSRLRISRSLRRSIRRYRVSYDQHFPEVVAACGDPGRSGHWITDGFRVAYGALHTYGWAHSVEVWEGNELVGGLFGVEVGGLFSGESMFHRRTDASKVALVGLVDRLRTAPGRRLLDVQWWTPHLATLGAVQMPRPVYLRRLAEALPEPPAFP
jgi:leucyl/phenylalanyl-tRNA---protein transferase